jgi:adenine phosphoribosyltransferase
VKFKDIMPLFHNPTALAAALAQMQDFMRRYKPTVLSGLESRGLMLATPLALNTGLGHVPIRKGGKLPGEVKRIEYECEYGTGVLEVQTEFLKPNLSVALIDDTLATGGTVKAAIELLQGFGVRVVCALFLIELKYLNGAEKLGGIPYHSVLTYDS